MLAISQGAAKNTLNLKDYNYTLKVSMADSQTIQFDATVLDQTELIIGFGSSMFSTEMIAFFSNGDKSFAKQAWSSGEHPPAFTQDSDNNL